MPDANALNASFMCFIIGAIHITTYVYTEQIISLIIGSVFMFLCYKLYVYGDWSDVSTVPIDSFQTVSDTL